MEKSKSNSLNYYSILGLPFNSSNQDIKRAYYDLAIRYHPDKNQNKQEALDKFKMINKAYSILSDEILIKNTKEVITQSEQYKPQQSVENSKFAKFPNTGQIEQKKSGFTKYISKQVNNEQEQEKQNNNEYQMFSQESLKQQKFVQKFFQKTSTKNTNFSYECNIEQSDIYEEKNISSQFKQGSSQNYNFCKKKTQYQLNLNQLCQTFLVDDSSSDQFEESLENSLFISNATGQSKNKQNSFFNQFHGLSNLLISEQIESFQWKQPNSLSTINKTLKQQKDELIIQKIKNKKKIFTIQKQKVKK